MVSWVDGRELFVRVRLKREEEVLTSSRAQEVNLFHELVNLVGKASWSYL